jgi:hypothetical protein
VSAGRSAWRTWASVSGVWQSATFLVRYYFR